MKKVCPRSRDLPPGPEAESRNLGQTFSASSVKMNVTGAAAEWPTGNGRKLSSSQAQLGQATCLDVDLFLFISCGPSCGPTRYVNDVLVIFLSELTGHIG